MVKVNVFRNLWVFYPLTLLILTVAVIVNVEVPLVTAGIYAGKKLYSHYVRKHDAETWPKAKATIQKEKLQLDSLLKHIESRTYQGGGTLVDELYTYASAASFHPRKVEAGIPLIIAQYTETALSIDGSGNYAAIGKLVEKIENSSQSTRIRQLVLTKKEATELDVFIDVVVREEVEHGKK